MMTTPRSLPVLTTALGASFRCSSCGDCCRNWHIQVDAATFHAICDLLPRGPRALTPAQCFMRVEPQTQQAFAYLGKQPDGACVFLDPDNLCYLHRHFGPAAKPRICRTFPFRPVERPDGVYAPASLGCTSLRRGLAAVTATTPGLVAVADEGLAALAYDRYPAGARVDLTATRQVPVEGLAAVEERLAELLYGGGVDLPPWPRLLGLRHVVEEVAGTTGPLGAEEAGQACRTAIGPGGAALRARLAGVGPDLQHHLVVLLDLTQRMDLAREEVRVPRLSRQCAAFGMDRGLPIAERNRFAAQVYAERWAPAEAGVLPVLQTFLAERLRASNVTMRHGLLGTVDTLIAGAALVRFFACGLAVAAGRGVTRDDVMAAIAEVEGGLFHNLRVLAAVASDAPEGQRPWARDARTAAALLLLP